MTREECQNDFIYYPPITESDVEIHLISDSDGLSPDTSNVVKCPCKSCVETRRLNDTIDNEGDHNVRMAIWYLQQHLDRQKN